MILLILLLAVCDAVHMNSNYFKQAVMPSDCSIQPSQKECIEYAQLTMTQDFGYVQVSSGPAAMYVAMSSGSAAAVGDSDYLSETECPYDNTVEWSSDPPGCIQAASTVRWNTAESTASCTTSYKCLKKSANAAAYLTEAECSQVSDYVTDADWSATASGCVFWGTPRTVYYNRNINTHECGYNSQWCIQKHSYYNFGHVEVTAGAPALEEDIRHVSEKECEVYAGASWRGLTSHSDRPLGCYLRSDSNVIYYQTTVNNNIYCDPSWICIQRDVITHHVAAEGCLSDGKVRWNIPFLEVSSGSPATLGIVMPDGSPAVEGSPEYMSPADCGDYADTIGATYNPNTEGSRPKGCWHFTGSGTSNALYYNEHATGGGSCTTDWSGYPQYCIQKSPIAAAYVSEEECSLYAGDNDYASSDYGANPPGGCYRQTTNNNAVRWNSHSGVTGDCTSARNCIQKPMTELPCAPHQCICKRGNVVGTTYQAGSLSDRFWEYGEVSSGSPAVEGSAEHVSLEECKKYGESIGKWNNAISEVYWHNSVPKGCYICGSSDCTGGYINLVQYNTASTVHPCGNRAGDNCIQKVTKTHKFIEVTTGMPATITYEEVTSGKPDESLSEAECLEYHNSRNGLGYHDNTNGDAFPRGCYIWGNGAARPTLYFGKTNEYGDCGHTYGNDIMICVQKSPDNRHVTELECEQYAVNTDGVNWGGQTDLTSKPFACYMHSGSAYYNKYSLSTTPCSSSEICIQKAPFHAQSVQSMVKQAIDAVLHAEMHYAESVNVFIEDFDHPKTTASDTLYTKQASYEVTDFNFLYSTITANEEWRPALPFNTLEEAKASCSADSSNCLGVTHRHLGGVDLYLRHNGNSHSQLASHDQEHDERLYFQLLDRPFFIRFPIDASTVENSDLKALCDSYPSCFARGNYVNTYDVEWDSSNYPGHTSGNYIAVFYKQFQLQQATKVNAVYTSPEYVQVSSGSAVAEGSGAYVSQAECGEYAEANGKSWAGTRTWNGYPIGCFLNINHVYYNLASTTTECSASNICIQKAGYVSVDTLYEAFQGCNASTSCEGITGYQEVTVGAAATQTVLLDQDLLINDGDDFQLIVYDFQTDDCVGSGGDYTVTPYADKGTFDVLEACRRGGSSVNPASMFGKRVLHKTAVATETCSEDCTSLGYTVSQMMDSGIRYIQVYHGILGDSYFSIHNGAPDLSISSADACQAAADAHSHNPDIWPYVWSALTWSGSHSWSNRPTGCHVYLSGHGTSDYPHVWHVYWNTQTTTTSCYSWYTSGGSHSWRNLGCFQQYAMEVDADKKVDESECEAYAASVNKPYSNAISSQASDQHENYIPGCQADSVNVYWNPSTTAPRVCGHGGNACIQKVHDATCLCTKKVGTSGHNIKTDCFSGFEFKEEVVQVSSGSPVEGSPEWLSQSECHVYASTIGTNTNTPQNYGDNRPSGCFYDKPNNKIYFNTDLTSTDTCVWTNYPCLQKRKACQPCPAGTTINANFGDFIQVSSGAADDSVTETECKAYNDANGRSWTSSGYPERPSGCIADSAWTYWNTHSNSNNCATNYKCIQKAKACDLCPAGSDSTPYSSECFSCPDGESSVPGGRCTNCNAGQFQAGGSGCTNCNAGLYQNENGAAVCKSCPIGSSSNAGSDALTDCNLCTAAYYLVGNTCTICPGGKYSGALASSCTNCAAGTYGQSGVCSVCQAGKFQNEQGKSSCKLCPQGSYRTTTGGSSSSSCTSCTAGKYNGNQGSTSNVCANCPAGTISAARSSGCSNCPAGQFQSSSGQSSCGSCAGGKYQNFNGQTSCKLCGAGKYHNNNGQTAESACTNCAAGTYSSAGATSCTNCAAGKFQGSTGSASCQNCPAGMYQPTEGQNGCLNCDAGQYSGQQATACSDCVAGQSSGVGQGICLNCVAGTYSAAGAATCTNCAAGKYSTSGQPGCNICAAGQYSGAGTGYSSPLTRYITTSGSPDLSVPILACQQYALENSYTYIPVQSQYYFPHNYGSCTSWANTNQCVDNTAPSSSEDMWVSCKLECSKRGSPKGCVKRGSEVWYNTHDSSRNCGYASVHCIEGTGFDECTNCAIGTYAAAGSGACTNCAIGMAVNSLGNDLCDNCVTGKFQNEMGKGTCKNCAAGRFQDETGKSSCKSCDLGKISGLQASSCTACATGKMTRRINQGNADLTQCFDCGIGYYNDEQGKHWDQISVMGTTSFWCKMCDNGKYQNQVGQSSCKNCAVGKYYDDPYNGAANCDSCAQGKYQNEEGKSSCKDCPEETWAATAGQSSCSNCQTHQGGTFVGSQVYWDGASGTGLTSGRCCTYLVLYPGHPGATFCENRNEIHGP